MHHKFLYQNLDKICCLDRPLGFIRTRHIMISPFNSLKGIKEKAPFETWFKQQLDHNGHWPVCDVNERTSDALIYSIEDFSDARIRPTEANMAA